MHVCSVDKYVVLLYHVLILNIIAEREATNLAVRVLGWRGVVSRFRNTICHASGMQFVTL